MIQSRTYIFLVFEILFPTISESNLNIENRVHHLLLTRINKVFPVPGR